MEEKEESKGNEYITKAPDQPIRGKSELELWFLRNRLTLSYITLIIALVAFVWVGFMIKDHVRSFEISPCEYCMEKEPDVTCTHLLRRDLYGFDRGLKERQDYGFVNETNNETEVEENV